MPEVVICQSIPYMALSCTEYAEHRYSLQKSFVLGRLKLAVSVLTFVAHTCPGAQS